MFGLYSQEELFAIESQYGCVVDKAQPLQRLDTHSEADHENPPVITGSSCSVLESILMT